MDRLFHKAVVLRNRASSLVRVWAAGIEGIGRVQEQGPGFDRSDAEQIGSPGGDTLEDFDRRRPDHTAAGDLGDEVHLGTGARRTRVTDGSLPLPS